MICLKMHGRGSNEGQCLLLDTLTSRATGPDLESHYSRHPMSHLIHIADQKNAAGRGCLMSNLGWKGGECDMIFLGDPII